MNDKDVHVLESEKIAAFTGEMSIEVIKRKIDLIINKPIKDEKELRRLRTVLFARKYSAMTMAEIGAKWDGTGKFSDKWDIRYDMAFECPDFVSAYDEALASGYDIDVLDGDIFGLDWDDQDTPSIDVRPFFEKYCKK